MPSIRTKAAGGGCSHVTDLVVRRKLDCPHAMGTNAFSSQRAESFRHFLLLPSPPAAYHRRKQENLRVSFGTRAARFQASGLWLRSHAGACSSAAQRTATRFVGRCTEVVEARSVTASDWRRGSALPNNWHSTRTFLGRSRSFWAERSARGAGLPFYVGKLMLHA